MVDLHVNKGLLRVNKSLKDVSIYILKRALERVNKARLWGVCRFFLRVQTVLLRVYLFTFFKGLLKV